jgi:preprotein translocase subunit SecB
MNQENSIIHSPFRFRNFVIAESHIKIRPETQAKSISIKIKPKGIIWVEKKVYDIHLTIDLKSEDGLDVSVLIIGFFDFKEVLKTGNLNSYFYINAPAIIFPFLRSYIASLTALSGCSTVILPPMNMTPLGKELENNTIEK